MRKLLPVLLGILVLSSLFSACGSDSKNTATVESVANILNQGYIGLTDRFAGVVSASKETVIKKETSRVIDEIKVTAGDTVTEGQVLFTYDTEAMSLSLEKAKLQVEQTQGSITSLQSQKKELEKERAAAGSSAQLNYTLEIKDVEAQIREAQYNLSLQQKEADKLQSSMDQGDVTSPVAGVIQSVNTDSNNNGNDASGSESGSGSGTEQAFITIMETGDYTVKGSINEANRSVFSEGAKVLVRSRVDETIWHGTVSRIDWENPIKNNNNNNGIMTDGSSSNEMTTSSNYPFYVELSDDTGLMLGQHVYIEADFGQADTPDGLCLPSYYLNDIDEENATAWVWAADKHDKLEKRSVKLGQYVESQDCWLITDGLTAEDRITIADDTLEEGMKVTEYDPNAVPEEDSSGTNSEEEMAPETDGQAPVTEGGDMADDAEMTTGEMTTDMPADTGKTYVSSGSANTVIGGAVG